LPAVAPARAVLLQEENDHLTDQVAELPVVVGGFRLYEAQFDRRRRFTASWSTRLSLLAIM
jgi:hypothetical protein